jgi:hypothetical protein
MSRRVRWAMFGAVAAASWVLPGMATPVAGQAQTTCTGEHDFTLTPGLSNEPGSGSFTTGGETGTIDCQGEKGSWGFAGEYGTKDPDSCTSGGEGTVTHSVTWAGGENITEDGEFTYGALQSGVFGGSFETPRMSGDFEVTPTEGDCVTAPITKAHAVFKNVVIKDS